AGFKTPHGGLIDRIDDRIMEMIDAQRRALPYETDGVVLKLNDFKLQQELGEGTKSPRWAVAYKFPPERGFAKLLDVLLPVGRTGVITPGAVLSPVMLNGATVQRASLCNFDEIQRLDIAIGDTVVVVRAAEVIPKVIAVHKKAEARRLIPIPSACP